MSNFFASIDTPLDHPMEQSASVNIVVPFVDKMPQLQKR
jgi:hypothetical protein